jgi:hypothetical protein
MELHLHSLFVFIVLIGTNFSFEILVVFSDKLESCSGRLQRLFATTNTKLVSLLLSRTESEGVTSSKHFRGLVLSAVVH